MFVHKTLVFNTQGDKNHATDIYEMQWTQELRSLSFTHSKTICCLVHTLFLKCTRMIFYHSTLYSCIFHHHHLYPCIFHLSHVSFCCCCQQSLKCLNNLMIESISLRTVTGIKLCNAIQNSRESSAEDNITMKSICTHTNA